MTEEVKLVLHVGQRMIDVADWEDITDVLYWDERWRENGPSNNIQRRLADAMNRMRVPPEQEGQR